MLPASATDSFSRHSSPSSCPGPLPAYGKVFLVRKVKGFDAGKLFAMKVLKKAAIVVSLRVAVAHASSSPTPLPAHCQTDGASQGRAQHP
jgi:hypothetical protein